MVFSHGAPRRRRADLRLPALSFWPGHSPAQDRKSTRLNSSHPSISYAVFCLKKKTPPPRPRRRGRPAASRSGSMRPPRRGGAAPRARAAGGQAWGAAVRLASSFLGSRVGRPHGASGEPHERDFQAPDPSGKRRMAVCIEQRADPMTDDDAPERSPVVEFGLFVLIALLMLADLVDDAGTADLLHLVLEGIVMIAAGAGVLLL